jgi:hypothetical protein
MSPETALVAPGRRHRACLAVGTAWLKGAASFPPTSPVKACSLSLRTSDTSQRKFHPMLRQAPACHPHGPEKDVLRGRCSPYGHV